LAKQEFDHIKPKVQEILNNIKKEVNDKVAELKTKFNDLENQIGSLLAHLLEAGYEEYTEAKVAFENLKKRLQVKLQQAKAELAKAEDKLKAD